MLFGHSGAILLMRSSRLLSTRSETTIVSAGKSSFILRENTSGRSLPVKSSNPSSWCSLKRTLSHAYSVAITKKIFQQVVRTKRVVMAPCTSLVEWGKHLSPMQSGQGGASTFLKILLPPMPHLLVLPNLLFFLLVFHNVLSLFTQIFFMYISF
ncbi:hypothetical protein K501DRAFT_275053 [Backusella circina FSU 941]|nr:hypothetical protein K501DRAFT_275053 [Backusella circina FSU 941]